MKRRFQHSFANEFSRGVGELWRAMHTPYFWMTMGALAIIVLMLLVAYSISMGYDSFAVRFSQRLSCHALSDQDALILILIVPSFILVSLLALGELFLFIDAHKKKRRYQLKHLLIFMGSALALGIGGMVALKAFC